MAFCMINTKIASMLVLGSFLFSKWRVDPSWTRKLAWSICSSIPALEEAVRDGRANARNSIGVNSRISRGFGIYSNAKHQTNKPNHTAFNGDHEQK